MIKDGDFDTPLPNVDPVSNLNSAGEVLFMCATHSARWRTDSPGNHY